MCILYCMADMVSYIYLDNVMVLFTDVKWMHNSNSGLLFHAGDGGLLH